MSAVEDSTEVGPGAHWSGEHRFEVITAIPEVQAARARHAAGARLPMSAEEFLGRATAVLPWPMERAVQRGAGRGPALGRRWGLRTGASRDVEVSAPVGRAVAAALCSLAGHGQAVQSVEQGDDGCTVVAAIPSDHKTFGGVLRVTLLRAGGGRTSVHAEAEIPGQLIDWGKSKQTLTALVADLQSLTAPGAFEGDDAPDTDGTAGPAAL
jgi:hypothetical protein